MTPGIPFLASLAAFKAPSPKDQFSVGHFAVMFQIDLSNCGFFVNLFSSYLKCPLSLSISAKWWSELFSSNVLIHFSRYKSPNLLPHVLMSLYCVVWLILGCFFVNSRQACGHRSIFTVYFGIDWQFQEIWLTFEKKSYVGIHGCYRFNRIFRLKEPIGKRNTKSNIPLWRDSIGRLAMDNNVYLRHTAMIGSNLKNFKIWLVYYKWGI